ncbi:hypothetical protein ACFLVH_05290 [Chloroflexota bacterium]
MLTQLLDRTNAVLLNQNTLEELEGWLVSHLQEILDSGSKKAIEIANRIDADLIGYSEDLLDLSTLYERLQLYYYNAQTIYKEFGFSSSTDVITIADATPVVEVKYRQPVEV